MVIQIALLLTKLDALQVFQTKKYNKIYENITIKYTYQPNWPYSKYTFIEFP